VRPPHQKRMLSARRRSTRGCAQWCAPQAPGSATSRQLPHPSPIHWQAAARARAQRGGRGGCSLPGGRRLRLRPPGVDWRLGLLHRHSGGSAAAERHLLAAAEKILHRRRPQGNCRSRGNPRFNRGREVARGRAQRGQLQQRSAARCACGEKAVKEKKNKIEKGQSRSRCLNHLQDDWIILADGEGS
jgi:hypothetical protein